MHQFLRPEGSDRPLTLLDIVDARAGTDEINAWWNVLTDARFSTTNDDGKTGLTTLVDDA